ncbi:MAG: MerR family transcriptional regulator [Actinomycetota bacterium]
MRISELSRASGVSVATIKYWIREGLVPPGATSAPNQAAYDDAHLHRVRLIRALREVADLPIATVADVLAVVDDEGVPVHDALGRAHRALADVPDIGDSPTADEAIDEVDTWLRTMGWQVSADAPDRIVLAHALLVMREMGREESAVDFQPWAEAAMRLAEHEVGTIEGAEGRADAVERMVVGTVVHGQVLGALRRLAQEHLSAQRIGGPPPPPGEAPPTN